MKLSLLGKTELWIKGIRLEQADLSRIAAVISDILKLESKDVFVTDASDDHITLDILRSEVEAENLYGKKREMFRRLAEIPGVRITSETTLHSEGILGLVSLEEEVGREVIEKSEVIAAEVTDKVQRRCMVFPTGDEVHRGLIKDTNSPYLKDRLESEGFTIAIGMVLRDDIDVIFAALNDAINSGYGLIITTGGVGAESKDRTIEAMIRLDKDMATPYIAKYRKGTGRHEKDGVRIGVGRIGPTLLVALPGPNDEVRMSIEALISGLKKGYDKQKLAEEIARTLKGKYFSDHEDTPHHGH
jgi:molybdenum cofactor synthesis domain-containing protein